MMAMITATTMAMITAMAVVVAMVMIMMMMTIMMMTIMMMTIMMIVMTMMTIMMMTIMTSLASISRILYWMSPPSTDQLMSAKKSDINRCPPIRP